ncbi:PREDICTED: spermatogenesis-associated protein 31D1-like [Elephantulus edwardii]|uniref:spermatogenesis-associated protein 31D1-like n=1 Tax=Elephantulus edwardii TaxID=28737 RepID=UPI0003F0D3C8|nr:PREDICTED: spermatogenesis-associated protein 31D1-like [Elephantulus edwardii]
MKKILKLHLIKKFWQINECRIPLIVCHSWLADDGTLRLSGSSHDNFEHGNEGQSVGREYCQSPTLDTTSLDPITQQMLEAHIVRFRMNQKWGLPLKVHESIKFYTLREAKSWPLPQFELPSSTYQISAKAPEAIISQSFEVISQDLPEDKLLPIKSVSTKDCLLSAVSPVDKEEQKTLKPFDSDQILPHGFQTTEDDKQDLFPLKQSVTHRRLHSEPITLSRQNSEVNISEDDSRHELKDKHVSFKGEVEMFQETMTGEENLEHVPVTNLCREIVKAEEFFGHQSSSCDILTTRELGNAQITNMNMSKVGNALIKEVSILPRMSVSCHPELLQLEKQLMNELKLKFHGQSQVESCSTNTPFASTRFPSTACPIHDQKVPCVLMASFPDLHVHRRGKIIRMEERQKLSNCKHVLEECQIKNFTPTDRKVTHQGPRLGQYRTNNLGLEILSKSRGKDHLAQTKKLETKKLDSPVVLSQKEESPEENFFRKKVKQLFQWIYSKRKYSVFQKSNILLTPAQCQDPLDSGSDEAQELMAVIGKMLEEKLGCREGFHHETEMQVHVESTDGPFSNIRALSTPEQRERSSTNVGSQKAVPKGHSCHSRERQIRNKNRHLQQTKGFHNHLISQSYCSIPNPRESVCHGYHLHNASSMPST